DVQAADAATDRRGQGPLDPDEILAEGRDRLVGQPISGLVVCLFSGKDFFPLDLAISAVGLLDRGIKDANGGRPDIGADAVAFDEGDDGVVGDNRPVGAQRDLFGHRCSLRGSVLRGETHTKIRRRPELRACASARSPGKPAEMAETTTAGTAQTRSRSRDPERGRGATPAARVDRASDRSPRTAARFASEQSLSEGLGNVDFVPESF